ncbi:WD40 repeat-like protein, partial [Auricularia subglabra TFB-10046 SS5]
TKVFNAHEDAVQALAYAATPDGLFASGSKEGIMHLWAGASFEPVGHPLGTGSVVRTVTFSCDGKFVASGCDDGRIIVWSTQLPVAHNDIVRSVLFSPDCTHIVSGSADGTIRIWD